MSCFNPKIIPGLLHPAAVKACFVSDLHSRTFLILSSCFVRATLECFEREGIKGTKPSVATLKINSCFALLWVQGPSENWVWRKKRFSLFKITKDCFLHCRPFRQACGGGFIRARGCISNCWVERSLPKRTWGMPGMSLRCVLIEKTDVTRSSKNSDPEGSAGGWPYAKILEK